MLVTWCFMCLDQQSGSFCSLPWRNRKRTKGWDQFVIIKRCQCLAHDADDLGIGVRHPCGDIMKTLACECRNLSAVVQTADL
jgi:hypothetical protein